MTLPDDSACLHSKEPTYPNSPDLGISFCPMCEPERSVLDKREDGKVWFEKLCGHHDFLPKGDADDEARSAGIGDAFLPSSQEANSQESNRAACDIVHGRRHDA